MMCWRCILSLSQALPSDKFSAEHGVMKPGSPRKVRPALLTNQVLDDDQEASGQLAGAGIADARSTTRLRPSFLAV